MKCSNPFATALAIQALAFVLIVAACGWAGPPEQSATMQPRRELRWDFEDGDTGDWAGVNSSVGLSDEVAHGGSARALRVDAGRWGANFKLESRELASARSLTFHVWCELAEGKPGAWPQLWVNGVNTNLWVGPRHDGSLEGGRWAELRVDLAPYERPRSVTIQVWGARHVYVDDVTAAIRPEAEARTLRATVTVRMEKVLHTVAPDAHGTNLVALWNNTGDSPGAVRAFSQMGLGLLRFPGGVPAQWYDWNDPLASGWTVLTPVRAWKMAQAGGARMIFQTNTATSEERVNKRTGRPFRFDNSPEHQAGWVSFSRDEGIEVAFWEIGNEPEKDAPKPLREDQSAIYDWYNGVFEKQARAIKAADPRARVLGPASTNAWYWWAQGNLVKFLRAHGDKHGTGLVDGVSLHWYPEGGKGPWEERRGKAQRWAGCMEFIRGVVKEHDSRDLPVFVTEWNWGGGMHNRSARKLSNALGCADSVGMFLRTGVAGHTHFCLQKIDRNWGILAMRKDSRPENQPAPTYFALVLAARLHGSILDVSSDADARNVLSAYGARAADGTVRVMLINKTGDQIDAALSLAGRRQAYVETLRGLHGGIEDEDVVFNGVESPDPSRNDLPAPRLEPARDRWMLPPYSITLVSFP